MNCSSEPGVIAAGAEPRTCRANVASPPRIAPPLLRGARAAALAAPAQAQPTTVTQSGDGATWSLVGENTVAAGQQTYTYTLTRTSGSLPLNEYFGFTSDTLEAERFQDGYSDCTGTNYFCFTLSNSYSYSEYTVSNVRFAGRILTDTSPHVLTLKVATGTPAGTTVTLGVVRRSGVPRSGGLLITVGTATTNTAPTAADKTVTTGEDRAYAFTADDFGFDDDDAGDTLASVTIVTPPAAGTLALDGTAVMADDVVTKAQIDGDMLTFTPARDAHGDPYTTFTFTVNDGTDDSASAYTMTIDVTDAPAPVCGVPGIAGAGRRQIWTGTVTVGTFAFLGPVTAYGFEASTSKGSLLPSNMFSIGSSDHTISAISVGVSGILIVTVDANELLTATEEAALRLHVCDENLDFSAASAVSAGYAWTGSLDWSAPVVTRTLYLSLPANNDATGEPAITGTAQAGQELTADASPIMDTDGLTGVSYSYQWVRVDADGTSNEEDISGEIAETYTLTNDDVGKKIKVQVSFTDELSGEEMRTSEATATVVAAGMTACGVPDFGTRREIWSGVVTVKAITSGSDTVGYGFSSTLTNTGGGLAPLVFTIGQNDYTIDGLYVYDTNHATFPGDLLFDLTGNSVSGNLTTAESDVLQVHPCDTGPYAFLGGVAQYAGLTNGYLWSSSLDWSDPVVTRTVY